MRPISKRVLARHLAAIEIVGAACKGMGQWWSEQEAAHLVARTTEAAAVAAAPAMAICTGCPAIAGCSELAVLDRYSGFAAGGLYVNGVRHQASTVQQLGTSERKAG